MITYFSIYFCTCAIAVAVVVVVAVVFSVVSAFNV